MDSQNPLESELIERLDWLIRLRWLAVLGITLILALGWFWYPGQLLLLPLAGVTLGIALLNALFSFHARTVRSSQAGTARSQQVTRFAYIQIALDLLALSALLHLSGGAENPVALFFVFHVIIAGTLLSRRASFGVATLAALLFAGVGWLEYAGVLPHHHLPILEGVEIYHITPYLLAVTGVLAFTLWLTAYMTSLITARLRRLAQRHRSTLDQRRELEALNVRLQKIDAERSRFLTLVTHELRAPINTIHTCVELALSGYGSPEKVRDILERVEQRTAELSELISDLLRLARAREETSRDQDVELTQPGDVLESVIQLMEAEAYCKDLFLSVDIDPDLSPILANPDRLKLVWTNLLSNAIKYTEPGGIVAVKLKQSEQHLLGTVRDTGIGISAEDQKRIFEEFYRTENACAISPVGTGVGLAIAQRIVENWGGNISVESELGLGSKFTIMLPRVAVSRET